MDGKTGSKKIFTTFRISNLHCVIRREGQRFNHNLNVIKPSKYVEFSQQKFYELINL